jgi:hypothetical protein
MSATSGRENLPRRGAFREIDRGERRRIVSSEAEKHPQCLERSERAERGRTRGVERLGSCREAGEADTPGRETREADATGVGRSPNDRRARQPSRASVGQHDAHRGIADHVDDPTVGISPPDEIGGGSRIGLRDAENRARRSDSHRGIEPDPADARTGEKAGAEDERVAVSGEVDRRGEQRFLCAAAESRKDDLPAVALDLRVAQHPGSRRISPPSVASSPAPRRA